MENLDRGYMVPTWRCRIPGHAGPSHALKAWNHASLYVADSDYDEMKRRAIALLAVFDHPNPEDAIEQLLDEYDPEDEVSSC